MQRNKAVGSVFVAFDLKLLRLPNFWLLVGWGFFSILGYIVLLFSLPSYARSVGLTAQQGSVIGAVLNLGQGKMLLLKPDSYWQILKDIGLGRPPVGYFSDSFGRINMAGGCTFLCGVLCLVFVRTSLDTNYHIFAS
jgi:MFS family permease